MRRLLRIDKIVFIGYKRGWMCMGYHLFNMQAFAVCLSLLAVASASIYPHHSLNLRLKSELDDLVKQALEKVREQLKAHDPYSVPDMPPLTINDEGTNTKLTLHTTDVKVSHGSDFVIDDIENNMITLTAKFGMSFPFAHYEGKFSVSGTAMGKTVSGDGTFSIDITNYVLKGISHLEYQGAYLHMKDNQVSYTIQDIKVKGDGLNVEGMTKQQIDDFLSQKFLEYLQTNEPVISEKMAEQAMTVTNQLLKGKTLQDLINWLKDFIKHPYFPIPGF